MNFLDLPEGESVFIDANVFVYAFAADPTLGPPCRDLVERIGRKELEAYLSTSVFTEIAHRLMTLEACVAFGWPYAGIAQRLRRHPGEIVKLQRFRETSHPSLPASSAARYLPAIRRWSWSPWGYL